MYSTTKFCAWSAAIMMVPCTGQVPQVCMMKCVPHSAVVAMVPIYKRARIHTDICPCWDVALHATTLVGLVQMKLRTSPQ